MIYKERGQYRWMRLKGLTIADYWWTIIPLAPIIFAINVWYDRLGGESVVLFTAMFLILTAGILLHEWVHMIAYRGTIYEKRITVKYWGRANVKIRGSVAYGVFRKSCLAPLWITAALAACSVILIAAQAGWIGPLLLMTTIFSLGASMDDVYWIWKTRKIGSRGRYFDRGRRLDVVWKKEE